MKKSVKKVFKWITFIWQLPQHLLGLAMIAIIKPESKTTYKSATIYMMDKNNFGISLGDIIILNKRWSSSSPDLIPHEYGHTIQSHMFGPLYLLVIGLPSITQNIICMMLKRMGKPKMWENYYKRFPENWADKLGGVDRK